MKLVQKFVTNNPCYKSGKKIVVKGFMLHSVGCPQPNAEVFVKQFDRAETKVCVHGFIDANTGNVYQTLPWDYKAWHCGGDANSTHIGVEMCEPACIKYTGGMTFTCNNVDEAQKMVRRTVQSAVELFAMLCKQYGLDPMVEGVIISHKEGHDRGLASGHGDPNHLFTQLQMSYTMDDFRKDVAAIMKQISVAEGTSVKMPSAPMPKTGVISVGTIVEISPKAVYDNGGIIPGWVKKDHWIIKSVCGERVVLGKNASQTNEINSPVNIKYLKVCTDAQQIPPSSQPKPTQPPQDMTHKEMKISDTGVELIAKYEGCRLEAYRCPAGVWTIGYGHTAGVKEGDRLQNLEQAKELLKEDLKKYGGYVNDCAKKGMIRFPLTPNQFDALTSFCYNCGAGSLQKLVAGREINDVADAMLSYNRGGGKVLPGLVRRRTEERELFMK